MGRAPDLAMSPLGRMFEACLVGAGMVWRRAMGLGAFASLLPLAGFGWPFGAPVNNEMNGRLG